MRRQCEKSTRGRSGINREIRYETTWDTTTTTSGGLLNLAIQTVSASLFSEWNPTPKFDSEPVGANYLLREWLDHPLGPARRIPDVLRHVLHVSPDCPAFRYDGTDYPNPYGFITPDFTGNQIDVSAGRGLVHGDLHGGNVLFSGTRRIGDYYFIDFSHFSSRESVNAVVLRPCVPRAEPAFGCTGERHPSALASFMSNPCRPRRSAAGIRGYRYRAGGMITSHLGLLWTVGLIREESYQ